METISPTTPPGPPPRIASGAPPEAQTQSLTQVVGRAWRFRRYFLPYLGPAIGLLFIAFVQADLLYISTVALSRVVNTLAVRAQARMATSQAIPSTVPAAGQAPAATPGPAPAPLPGAQASDGEMSGSKLSLEPLVASRLIPPSASLGRLAAMMALFILVAEGIGLWREYLRTRLTERFRYRVQQDLLGALARERADTRTRRQGGVTNEIFANDATGLASLLIFGLIGFGEGLVQVGKFSYEIARAGGIQLALLILPLILLMQGGLAKAFLGPESRLIERSQHLVMRLRGLSMQLFENLGRLTYFRGEAREIQRVLDLSVETNAANRRFMLMSSMRSTLSGLLTQLSFPLLVLLLLAVSVVAIDPGTLIGTQALVMALASSVAALSAVPAMVLQYGPSLRRLEDVLTVPDPGPCPPALNRIVSQATPPAVRCRKLSFRYPGSARLLLQDIDLSIPSGSRVGIVGRSGSGKSTLARLLIGDVLPEGGQILLDDVDVTQWHLWWRREIVGFLPAEQGFLRGTLEENVLFGRDHGSVRELARALELSGVAAIAREKQADGGLRFELHNPQEQLSSGQRRRVGIARLLIGPQPIWVFDEPGSQLDPRAMVDVARAITEASKGRTTLIITHDPDVFATNFNVFLKDGRIAAVGSHEELVRTNADYFDLVDKNVAEREQRGVGGTPTFPPMLPPPGLRAGPRRKKSSVAISSV